MHSSDIKLRPVLQHLHCAPESAISVQLVGLDKQRQGIREARRSVQLSSGTGTSQLTQQWITLPGHVDVRFSTNTALKWLDQGTSQRSTAMMLYMMVSGIAQLNLSLQSHRLEGLDYHA